MTIESIKDFAAISTGLKRAIVAAEERAGTLTAKDSVKLHPTGWHAVCDLGRKAANALEAQQKRIAELEDLAEAIERRATKAEVRVAELEAALNPFVNIRDALPTSQSIKLIHKKVDGLAPVALTVTKDQFLTARRALQTGEAE